MRMKLSVESARDLLPGGRIRDHVVKGLELRAGSHSKTWLFYYRGPDGSQRRPKIGAFPTLGIEDARAAARNIAKQLSLGTDPSAERQALRTAPTVADLAELYMTEYARRRKKPRSIEEDKRNVRLHVLPLLGSLRVADVKLLDINRALDKIAKRGAIIPNRVRSLLSTMFQFAEHDDYQWRPRGSNPVTHAQKRPESHRDRKIEKHEFEAVARELDRLETQYPGQVAVLRVALLAGTLLT